MLDVWSTHIWQKCVDCGGEMGLDEAKTESDIADSRSDGSDDFSVCEIVVEGCGVPEINGLYA